MKNYSVPLVFGIGLVVLIVGLVMLAQSSRELVEVKDIPLETVHMRDPFLVERQEAYNKIQAQYPKLSEAELLDLPEVQELLSDSWVPVTGDGIDAFSPLDIGKLKITSLESESISLAELLDIYGFLKYGTNIDENFLKLSKAVPAFLRENVIIPDCVNQNVNVFSKILKADLRLVFLSREFQAETRIFLVQESSPLNQVQELLFIRDYRVLDIILDKTQVFLNFFNPTTMEGKILLLQVRNQELQITSILNLEETVHIFPAAEEIIVEFQGNSFNLSANEAGAIVMESNFEKMEGTLNEGLN